MYQQLTNVHANMKTEQSHNKRHNPNPSKWKHRKKVQRCRSSNLMNSITKDYYAHVITPQPPHQHQQHQPPPTCSLSVSEATPTNRIENALLLPHGGRNPFIASSQWSLAQQKQQKHNSLTIDTIFMENNFHRRLCVQLGFTNQRNDSYPRSIEVNDKSAKCFHDADHREVTKYFASLQDALDASPKCIQCHTGYATFTISNNNCCQIARDFVLCTICAMNIVIQSYTKGRNVHSEGHARNSKRGGKKNICHCHSCVEQFILIKTLINQPCACYQMHMFRKDLEERNHPKLFGKQTQILLQNQITDLQTAISDIDDQIASVTILINENQGSHDFQYNRRELVCLHHKLSEMMCSRMKALYKLNTSATTINTLALGRQSNNCNLNQLQRKVMMKTRKTHIVPFLSKLGNAMNPVSNTGKLRFHSPWMFHQYFCDRCRTNHFFRNIKFPQGNRNGHERSNFECDQYSQHSLERSHQDLVLPGNALPTLWERTLLNKIMISMKTWIIDTHIHVYTKKKSRELKSQKLIFKRSLGETISSITSARTIMQLNVAYLEMIGIMLVSCDGIPEHPCVRLKPFVMSLVQLLMVHMAQVCGYQTFMSILDVAQGHIFPMVLKSAVHTFNSKDLLKGHSVVFDRLAERYLNLYVNEWMMEWIHEAMDDFRDILPRFFCENTTNQHRKKVCS